MTLANRSRSGRMDMNNIPPTMETMQPKGNDLQGLSALNNARVCRYAVMPAQAIDLDGSMAAAAQQMTAAGVGLVSHLPG